MNVESPGTIEAAVKQTLAEVSSQHLEGAQVVLRALARTLNPQFPPGSLREEGAARFDD